MSRFVDVDVPDTELLDFVQEETTDADTFIAVRRILNKLPKVDVRAVKHGRWLHSEDREGRTKCSECSFSLPFWIEWNGCPNCLAEMDGREN